MPPPRPPGTLDYVRFHAVRFYHTYRFCKKYLKPGDKLLSIGAGPGSIEKILKEDCGVEITVLDFPEAIEASRSYFDYLGFISYGANLASETLELPRNHYQMLLSSEVIEHVPKSPYD